MLISERTLDVLLKSRISYDLEFCSKIKIQEVSENLSKSLGKKVSVCDETTGIDLSVDHYKLEREYADGDKVIKLSTSYLPYQEARIELIKILNFIGENGFTNKECGLHINISINESSSNRQISQMNIIKFILEFNEDKVWKDFPERKNSPYSKSIKFIMPADKLNYNTSKTVLQSDFIYPNKQFYGVNFNKIHENYLRFNYIGGVGYEKKVNRILETQDYFIERISEVVNNPTFTQGNKQTLGKIIIEFKKVLEAYSSLKGFKSNYPNLGLMVNLDTDNNNITAFWPKIRDRIFDLLTEGGVTEGIINYDSNTGKVQLKDADLSNSFLLENFDIVNCNNATGLLNKCDIFGTTIIGAEINESNLFNGTRVNKCKLGNCYINRSSILENSFVNGPNTIMNGLMKGGVFKKGRITDISKFEDTEVIEYEKIRPGSNAKY
jgi:hypothetical protein